MTNKNINTKGKKVNQSKSPRRLSYSEIVDIVQKQNEQNETQSRVSDLYAQTVTLLINSLHNKKTAKTLIKHNK